jgi:tRNA A-37 threonylcarbamoyl transferase component Bud32
MRNSRPERRVGTRLAGRYRLDRLVANGGMAQVWEATDETLKRRVAVKILHDHLADASTIARFRAEGVTAARLTHPGVVAIFDTCSEGGLDAIVMEYVEGATLREVLDDQGPMAPRRVVPIVLDIADALHAAHRLGLVHRDVKPANVLLCADGSVKVTDFGIAKVRDDSSTDLTVPGTFLGTAKYLAPEQVEGQPVDARADVYSLGVVMYEMLSGTAPYRGDSDAAIALARLQRPPRPLREVAPNVPPALEAVVARAMERRPADRYPGTVELRAALAGADLDGRREADPTMVGAVAPTVDPGFVESERRWLVPAVFVIIVALSLTLAAVLIGKSDAGQQIVRRAKEAVGAEPTPTTTAEVPAVSAGIVGAFSFDPEGDAAEHDGELAQAWDGDTTTAWSTEGYNDRTFGIKSGVGLYVDLGAATDLDTLRVESPTDGWSASVYVADIAAPTLDGWGAVVTERTNIAAGSATFDLDSRRGRYVLVWITDLGSDVPKARTTMSEIIVASAS